MRLARCKVGSKIVLAAAADVASPFVDVSAALRNQGPIADWADVFRHPKSAAILKAVKSLAASPRAPQLALAPRPSAYPSLFCAAVPKNGPALKPAKSAAKARLLAPCTTPSAIIAVGRNYAEHAKEQGKEPPKTPMMFAKLQSSITDHGATVKIPPVVKEFDYEGELAVVIGKGGRNISEANAYKHVAGYSIMNDLSARDLQRAEGQWLRAKGGEGFSPFGPWIVTADEIRKPHELQLRTHLNGAEVQSASTCEMIFHIPRLIAHASEVVALRPGDILSTGTPSGVGAFQNPPRFLRGGDVVRIEIEGIGALEVSIATQ